MSNLLNEAIVDAKALKEAALKNAETAIIQKYSTEVKETLDKLLEQDELGLDAAAGGEDPLGGDLGADPMADTADPMATGVEGDAEEIVSDEQVPFAAVDNLSGQAKEATPVQFDLNLGNLQEAIAELQEEFDGEQQFDINEQEMLAILSEDEVEVEDEDEDPVGEGPKEDEPAESPMDEQLSLSDDFIESIVEKLTVDMGAELAGWAGRSSDDMRFELEKDLARRRSTDFEEDLEVMKKAQEELVFENKQLKEQNKQYKQATNELKEGLQNVNLSNARLLYTNRVLRNTSLNERQKETIVEAISRAGSVTEARTIFDTLQSTAQSTPQRGPKSLNEAITRRSSVIRASRREKTNSDPFSERMKRLAGIK